MKRVAALLALGLAACGGNALVDITPLGVDGSVDAPLSRVDGKTHDAESGKGDAGTHPGDSGKGDVTSPRDVGLPDTGTDSGVDSGTGPKDASIDVGTSHDTGVDTGSHKDSGPACWSGVACSSATSCSTPTNPCEVAICEAECCGIANAGVGVSCTTAGVTHGVCNGSGECVACLVASDCTPPTCYSASCTSGVCVNSLESSGTACTGTNANDKVCNGAGQCVECTSVQDCPTPPECETAACTLGTCTTHASAPGTSCAGGDVCDGTGNCVQCNQANDCPAAPVCQTATCTGHTCGTSDVASGTNCGPNQPGTCDGNGNCNVTSCNSPADCPPPSSACLVATCVMSGCSTGDAPAGTSCSDPGDANAQVCDGQGKCVQCTTNAECTTPQVCLFNVCL